MIPPFAKVVLLFGCVMGDRFYGEVYQQWLMSPAESPVGGIQLLCYVAAASCAESIKSGGDQQCKPQAAPVCTPGSNKSPAPSKVSLIVGYKTLMINVWSCLPTLDDHRVLTVNVLVVVRKQFQAHAFL